MSPTQPWDYPLPPVLHKYLRPGRIDVLVGGRVGFSQRSIFDDDHELQPDYGSYGTEEEIIRFLYHRASHENRLLLPSGIVRLVANSAIWQKILKNIARVCMKSPDQFGIFCLTESLNSEQMWSEYADDSPGFVDTTHPDFAQLSVPGHLGKVSYSDEPKVVSSNLNPRHRFEIHRPATGSPAPLPKVFGFQYSSYRLRKSGPRSNRLAEAVVRLISEAQLLGGVGGCSWFYMFVEDGRGITQPFPR